MLTAGVSGNKGVHTFEATAPLKEHCFKETAKSFSDHDDSNIIFDKARGQWVDMQVTYQNRKMRWCDNIGTDRRRVVTSRVLHGDEWSGNMEPYIVPSKEDSPELQLEYRIRPFYLGTSGRLAAHICLYEASPKPVIAVKGGSPAYGRQPPWYCKNGCCHAPHLYEEWWLGPPNGDPSDLSKWTRPWYKTESGNLV
eukprot:gene906-3407_t